MNIAINGFGRIGRTLLRTILCDPEARKLLKVVAINIGPADPKFISHMFKYDTLMGTYPEPVTYKNKKLIIGNDYEIAILSERDPQQCDWRTYAIDWVVESSGKFTHSKDAKLHCASGAEKVLISAPGKEEDISIIPGVNESEYDSKKHTIVSLGSCTTNAFIPMVKILQDAFGIERGFMTTIHAYTNSQVLLDVEDSDLRRARAAALNIIPTTTGASKMLGKLIPELDKVIEAVAIRVPVAKVSLIDLTVDLKKEVTKEVVHQAIKKEMEGRMKGIVDLSLEPLVSSDYSGTCFSVVIDGLLTMAHGQMVKLFGWYDNEWGYSERLKDFLMYVAKSDKLNFCFISKKWLFHCTFF